VHKSTIRSKGLRRGISDRYGATGGAGAGVAGRRWLTQFGRRGLLARLRVVVAGEYVVGQEIGRGGMGAVFKVLEIPVMRQVALKALLLEMGITAATVERFKREVSGLRARALPIPRGRGCRAGGTDCRSHAQGWVEPLLSYGGWMPWPGLEPGRLAPLPPQDSVSTNFTTRAGAET
jgi:hypothetical protein